MMTPKENAICAMAQSIVQQLDRGQQEIDLAQLVRAVREHANTVYLSDPKSYRDAGEYRLATGSCESMVVRVVKEK